ncbi:MAG: biotin/lipoyl-binding protein [Candidatus Heimdallarchaeota archaeon]|nr:biotin/lipoyl-binding protein [Candidatus Heimdallarchaeota archaeon]
MKKLITDVSGTEKTLELSKDLAKMENKYYEIEKINNSYYIKVNNTKYLIDEITKIKKGTYRIDLLGYTIDVNVIDPISEALNIDKNNNGEIKSPITGTLSKVLVTKGEHVKIGDTLVIISAMKMENNIISPINGIINEVYVMTDQKIVSGDNIISIKPDG